VQATIATTQEKAKDTITQASDKMKDLLKNPFDSGK